MDNECKRSFVAGLARDEWGLDLDNGKEPIKLVQTKFSSRVARVRTTDGQEYIVKSTISAHSNDDIDQACSFSTRLADSLAGTVRNESSRGSVRTLSYIPRVKPTTELQPHEFVYVHPTLPNEKPRRYVCCRVLPNTVNLKEAQSNKLLSRQAVRLHMARSLGVLHGSTLGAKDRLGDVVTDHHWHGTIRARLRDPLDRFTEKNPQVEHLVGSLKPDETVEMLEELSNEGLEQQLARLPKFPITNDLQSKNFIISQETGNVSIINTEILWRNTRLWDLIFLLILDDDCTGIFGEIQGQDGNVEDLEEDSQCLSNFASAIGVYMTHLLGATQQHIGFTVEEVDSFLPVLQVKLAQLCVLHPYISRTATRRHYKLLETIKTKTIWGDTIKTILREGSQVQSPNLSFSILPRSASASTMPPLFGNCFERIRHGDPAKPVKTLLYFNGTYAPFHRGHMEAAVLAARAVEGSDARREVVGIAFSPCHPSHLKRKLEEKLKEQQHAPSAALANDVVRIALIELSLSCPSQSDEEAIQFAKDLEFGTYNAFVDTNECLHHRASDMGRYDSIVNRFISTVDEANLHRKSDDQEFEPLICFTCGNDVQGYMIQRLQEWSDRNANVEGVVVSRTSEEEQIHPPAGIALHRTAPCEVVTSSSAIRNAWRGKDWDTCYKEMGVAPAAWWLAFEGQCISSTN